MRLSQNQKKHKNHPFLTILEKKDKVNRKPQQQKIVTETHQYLEHEPIEQHNTIKSRGKTAKQPRSSSINRQYAVNHSFMDLGRDAKSKRTLLEENSQLKKKLEQIALNKNRKDTVVRKMSTQFEKEMYWGGSQTYMISGVKLQYQKIKQSLEKKTQEYELLLRSMQACQKRQIIAYVEALEVQNSILATGAENKFKKAPTQAYDQETSISMIMWLRERLAQAELRVDRIRIKSKNTRNQLKQLRAKISFLQKLIIEKDNNEHSAQKSFKKAERERDQLQQKCTLLQSHIKTLRQDHQKEISDMKSQHIEDLILEREKLGDQHKQLLNFVQRIQRENNYLHSLVNSWKEEKQPRKEKGNELHKMEKTMSLPLESQVIAETNMKILNTSKLVEKVGTGLVKHTLDLQNEKRTEPYGADKKNSESSVKNRRVQPYEIEDLVTFGRLILTGKELDLDWVVSQFDYSGDDEWKQEYVNMLEMRTFFQSSLNLKEEEARLIARYIIEHSDNEHVYTDDLNEHKRAIVKSILKNLFGDYPIFKDQKKQYDELHSQWGSKLQFTLLNTTKGGVISKDRFEQLLQSLSLMKDPGFAVYLSAKMALVSDNLEEMKYSCLLLKKQ